MKQNDDVSQPVTRDYLDESLKKYATKTDIKDLKTESKSIRGEILRVEEKMENLEEDIKEIKGDNKKMDAKLDRIINTLDGFVGRVDDLTVDNEVGTHQTRELQLKIDNLEKRVKQIETSTTV